MKYLSDRVFAKLSPHQKAWHIWQGKRKIMKNKLATRVVAVKMQHWGNKQWGEIGDFYGNIIMPKRFQRNMTTSNLQIKLKLIEMNATNCRVGR